MGEGRGRAYGKGGGRGFFFLAYVLHVFRETLEQQEWVIQASTQILY